MLSPGFLPKAGFAPPGCAIAYSAYVFPDTLVSTTFHDYYLTLAVLNTIISIWLSCYSRYPTVLPWMGWGEGTGSGGARGSLDCQRGRGRGAWEPGAQFWMDFQWPGGTSFTGTQPAQVLRAP